MKPWEQHHAVISMPRFAYNPVSMMQQSAGFLVTCTFRREKSATKEILTLIQEYMKLTAKDVGLDNPVANASQTNGQPAEVEQAPLVSVISSVEPLPLPCPNFELVMSVENSQILETGRGAVSEDSMRKEAGRAVSKGKVHSDGHDAGEDEVFSQSGGGSSPNGEGGMTLNTLASGFTLVKLATMGVIYICASRKHPSSVLNVASRLLKDVQAGTKAAPQWCHRLVPVQATCSMKMEELQGVVSQLVKDHLRDTNFRSGEQPLNYAVAFNRRGADVAKDSFGETAVLGRDQCIKIVAAAVEEVITPVRVDLTFPQMVVIVELIPVAGAQSCLMCAVSVLPGDLTVSKPKLNIKPLAPLHPKTKKRKHQQESSPNA